jgi:Flp pilus assembly pilin Flp
MYYPNQRLSSWRKQPLTDRTVCYASRRIICLLADDEGQDLIEYVLLTGIIAVAGALLFGPIRTRMGAAYLEWNTDAQSIWVPPPPGG